MSTQTNWRGLSIFGEETARAYASIKSMEATSMDPEANRPAQRPSIFYQRWYLAPITLDF